MGIRLAAQASQREGEAVRRGSELADARSSHCGSPGYGASEYAVFAQYFADFVFRNSVLKGYENSIVLEVVLQESDYFLILQLLGHKEDDIVTAAHLIRGEGCDLLVELQGSGHGSSVCLKRRNVSLVAVDEVNLASFLCDECA